MFRSPRDTLTSLIEKEPGFKVVGFAADGLAAVRLVREVKPVLMLMDIHRPGMGGIEATRQITGALPEVKFIGVPVYVEDQVMTAMPAAGASSFVSKNSSPEELTEAIWAAVRSRKGN
jgi:DNA-binding NarL/FixJ family response regulator